MALILGDHRTLTHYAVDLGNNREFSQFRCNQRQPIFEKLTPPDPRYLFTEGSLSSNKKLLPQQLPQNNKWPKSFLQTKEEILGHFLTPHSYIPRIFYSVSPSTALKLGITHIFSQLYGIDHVNLVIERLHKTPAHMFVGLSNSSNQC